MDPLDYYILQARTNGQTDTVSRAQLIQAGWPADQVDAALGLTSQTTTTLGIKPKISKPLIILLSLITLTVIIIILGVALKGGAKTSDTVVANEFITAIEKGHQAKADSLESQALKNHALSAVGTGSFYKYCKSYGQVCTYFFSNSFISQAKVSYSSYTSKSGTKGKSLTLTQNGTYSSGSCAGSNYTNSLQIGLIPNGNSWLVDSINPTTSNNNTNCSPT